MSWERLKGIGAENGKHFLSAHDASEFCLNIEKLLHDRDLADLLSKNARKLVEENYSWILIGKKLNKIWREL